MTPTGWREWWSAVPIPRGNERRSFLAIQTLFSACSLRALLAEHKRSIKKMRKRRPRSNPGRLMGSHRPRSTRRAALKWKGGQYVQR